MTILSLRLRAAAALVLAAAAAPALAHHSFAMFDQKQSFTVNAVITQFQWANPHCWVEADVPGGKGAHKSFPHLSLEMNGLSGLRSGGWNAKTLKPGDKVVIEYHPMRDGTAAGQLVSVKLADGRQLKAQ
ncbi:hypothetical protein H7F51_00690 [Novosphingobium flavum]|uniref:Copper binding protein CusF n=1 Tax=Novosphingobium flavum TaxID=1778672 RepID=A0A7X1FNH5_9SPHN|nr:DUF6152 family protein [Novosphingobium flavum]MBC2664026.1 hypothetical protein [Novosphingobium flavum]